MTDEKISPQTPPSISKEEQVSEKQKSTLSQREVFGTLSMDALVLDQPFPSSPRRPYPRSSPSLDAAPAIPISPSLDNTDAPPSVSSPSLDNINAPPSVSSPSLDNADAPALKSTPSLDRIDEPPSSAPSSSAAKSLSQREVFGTLSMDALQLDQPFPLPSAKRSPPKRDALTPEQLHRALQQNAQSSPNNKTNDSITTHTTQHTQPKHRTRTLPLFLGVAVLLAVLTTLFLLRNKIF